MNFLSEHQHSGEPLGFFIEIKSPLIWLWNSSFFKIWSENAWCCLLPCIESIPFPSVIHALYSGLSSPSVIHFILSAVVQARAQPYPLSSLSLCSIFIESGWAGLAAADLHVIPVTDKKKIVPDQQAITQSGMHYPKIKQTQFNHLAPLTFWLDLWMLNWKEIFFPEPRHNLRKWTFRVQGKHWDI